jgi:flavin-dependent dehydrogenase
VIVDGQLVPARWIVGADGGNSQVRRWAGLNACARQSLRYGFRRHYCVAPRSEFMELHWGDGCQLYITPVAAQEVCVVLISKDQRLRLDQALPQFPEVEGWLRTAACATLERGGVTATRRLKNVCGRNVALIGDASGSVDAITGEGLCLLFQQAMALSEALAAGDLSLYSTEYNRIGRRPRLMANLMLTLDHRTRLRRLVMRTLTSHPKVFGGMLRFHVGRAA